MCVLQSSRYIKPKLENTLHCSMHPYPPKAILWVPNLVGRFTFTFCETLKTGKQPRLSLTS